MDIEKVITKYIHEPAPETISTLLRLGSSWQISLPTNVSGPRFSPQRGRKSVDKKILDMARGLVQRAAGAPAKGQGLHGNGQGAPAKGRESDFESLKPVAAQTFDRRGFNQAGRCPRPP